MSSSAQGYRFGLALLATTTVLLFAVAALNFIVNPYLLYPSRLFEPLIQTPREDKYLLLLERPTPPDVIIMGSSRAERIPPERATELTGLTTFNAAVNRATPVDFLVWTRFLLDGLQHTPRLLIVSLDPESFNPVQSWLTSAWLLNSPLGPYATDITLAGSGDPFEDTMRKLFSWQQAFDSLQVIDLELRQSRPPRAVIYDTDGGYVVADPEADLSRTVPDAGRVIPYYQDYPSLSEKTLGQLELFLALCQQTNIDVILFFPPYHDPLLDSLRAETDFPVRHDELLAEMNRLADIYGFTFFDLVEVSSFDGIPEIFVNGDHMDITNSILLLEHVLADYVTGQ